MPSVATRRWDTKAPSTLKRNTPGRWPIEQPHTCPPRGVHSSIYAEYESQADDDERYAKKKQTICIGHFCISHMHCRDDLKNLTSLERGDKPPSRRHLRHIRFAPRSGPARVASRRPFSWSARG